MTLRVAIVADERQLADEHAQHVRTCLGLRGEGAAVIRIVPASFDAHRSDPRERALAALARVDFEPHVPPWLRGWRRARLLAALERTPPDVILVAGAEAWKMAVELGRELECQVVLDVASLDDALRTARRRVDAADGTIAGCIVRSAPLTELVGSRLGPSVAHIPSAAVAAPRRGCAADPDRRRFIVVLGAGDDLRSSLPCFEAFRQLAKTQPKDRAAPLAFVELRGARAHELWQSVRSMDLLPRVCTVENASAVSEFIAGCDLLVVPERSGAVRGVLLDAMAAGVPVVALRDERVDSLRAEVTAAMLEESTADGWLERMSALLDDEPEARRLGASAAACMARSHSPERSAAMLHALLRGVVADETIDFAAPSGSGAQLGPSSQGR
ncbi:MAG TPA: glycosyltransferase [Phycisphaerales bacterium]|nr:glycosyltransferase [Phycisphaerales bacterium]HMP37971.1 glycosyltransferase [Phycisphaerales bacterium]